MDTLQALIKLSALLFYCGQVFALDDEYRIVMELSPPHQAIADNKIVGTIPEMISQNCARAGIKCRFEMYPWNRAFDIAKNDANTLISNIARTNEREALFKWIAPVHSYRFGFLAMSDRTDIAVDSIDDAKLYTIAVQRGDISAEYLVTQGFSEKTNLFLTADITESWRLLRRAKVDLIIEDPDNVSVMLDKLSMTKHSLKFVHMLDELTFTTWLAANKSMDDQDFEKLRAQSWLE